MSTLPVDGDLPEDLGTEYNGKMGPAGVPKYRPVRALTASDRARLLRLTGKLDPEAPVSVMVWNGEDVKRTVRQEVGDEWDEEVW